MPPISPVGGAGAYLQARLDLLTVRARALVDLRRRSDPHPDDRFRGLYVDDAEVDRLLTERDGPPVAPDGPAAPGSLYRQLRSAAADRGDPSRWAGLVAEFGLSEPEEEILLVAAAPDLEARFEKLYGYLNDDVTRRRASVGLALALTGLPAVDGAARHHLSSAGTLVRSHLVLIDDADRPLLSRALRVPDRLVAHLLGRDEPDAALADLVRLPATWPGQVDPVVRSALDAQAALLYAQDRPGGTAVSWIHAGLAAAGVGSLVVDVSGLDRGHDHSALAAIAGREARLRGAVLVVSGVDQLAPAGAGRVRPWAESAPTVALIGSGAWDPRWSVRPPILLDPPSLTQHEQSAVWARALGLAGDDEPPAAVRAYRLGPEQIEQAAGAARQRAATAGRPVGPEDLRAGARSQNSAGLEQLARRISPRAAFADLVVPAAVEAQLRALVARVEHRALVLDDWQLATAAAKGRGVTVLFSGDSGTGKTMSAEVIARELGLELYVIDLSTVVDKYIGETEKNLDRIFVEAERVNGVLLFDEADAIFGKRSEVKDARDRYANVEVAYLLQRMELFDGVAVLTTNLRANVDDAFLRRIDVLVDFPVPTAPERRRLWRTMLKSTVPSTGEFDLDFLARAFELSGGNIHNVVLTAAFEAAGLGGPLTMGHLVRAVAGEYRKLGRLCVAAEFGPWFSELPVYATAG